MSEFINPAIVPKKRLYTGEEIPCVGMGTFGSDRVSAEEVSGAVAGAIRCGYRLFDCAACYRKPGTVRCPVRFSARFGWPTFFIPNG